jgi:tetratricopeptide (TPR) repeat protein
MSARRTIGIGVSLVTALAFATGRVQEFRVRPYLHESLYLPSGRFIEQSSLGYRELAADLVWFQAVQYYGGYAKSQHDLTYFNALIDMVNDLDPNFVFPYVFGAVVMAQDLGDFERGIAVLKRGMQRNPRVWDLPFEIGFLYYTIARDADSAARYFELAARLPGGGERARRFAAYVHSKAGHLETSIRMWEELAQDADQPYMRELARRYADRLRREAAVRRQQSSGTDADSTAIEPPATGGRDDV